MQFSDCGDEAEAKAVAFSRATAFTTKKATRQTGRVLAGDTRTVILDRKASGLIAARYAQRKHGLGKVMIADWDVHHGNGTQDTFYRDGSVFFMSTHQSPWYPGTGAADETGEGKGKGCILNFPFPAGSGRSEIVAAFRENLRRAADAFKPDLVLISAGFDSRDGDPLGRFRLTDVDFTDLTKIMLGIGGTHSGGRLVSVLEGGYNLSGLQAAVGAHVQALAAS